VRHSAEIVPVFLFWLSLSVVAYSYLFYPLLLRLLARRFGRPPRSSPDHTPSVGVVIPVHNEEKVIAGKLRNIFSVDYPADRLSVWVGSDCSSDRTDEIVKEWGDPRVHIWRSASRNGKAGVLNQLIPQVDADIVLLTDADIMLDRGSVRALVKNYADPQVGGVGGITKIQKRAGDAMNSEENAYRTYEANQKVLESRLHSTISAFGSFYSIRKNLFTPFHPYTYSNDDVLMPMNIIRQGYRMCFELSAVSYEEFVPEMKIEFGRRIRIGAGNFQAFFWLLDFLNPVRGWPSFCYVSHKVSRWFSPMFMCLAAVCCGTLSINGGPFIYTLFFVSGLLFVSAGLLHILIPLPLARRVFYFLAMNLALIMGFFRFCAGIRSAVWSHTERPV
jgi:cellulose synthase/poly-beta-1,6-N-acetylglucosamine synthase-like glycosyltransferase